SPMTPASRSRTCWISRTSDQFSKTGRLTDAMVTRAAAVPRPIVGTQGSLHRDEVFWAYAFLTPWLIGLAVFIVGPILFSLGMSTFNYTLGREAEATFIGLGNWVRAFTKDELFWPSRSEERRVGKEGTSRG